MKLRTAARPWRSLTETQENLGFVAPVVGADEKGRGEKKETYTKDLVVSLPKVNREFVAAIAIRWHNLGCYKST